MIFLLVALVIAAAAAVVYALIKGLHAFANPGQDSYKTQNRAMFARVKWQAIAVLLVVIIGISVGG